MKKQISLLLILALITGLGLGFTVQNDDVYAMGAKDFTDVNTNYWGFSYIDFAAGNGIINGYLNPNGTYQFLPENSVTKEESIAMIYRALGAAGKLISQEDFSTAYEELFLENKIAEWAKKYVAYALKYGLLTEEELADFTDENGYGIPAPREQVALWSAKSINKEVAPAYSLIYSDKDSISDDYIPYIDMLYRHEIMQGDDTKKFNPASGIKRVEFAAISNRIFELLMADTYQTARETQSFRGTIVSVDSVNNKIMMMQSDGTGRVIQTNEKTQIVIDGELGYNGLKGIKTGTVAVIAWGAFCNQEEINNPGDKMQVHIITNALVQKGLVKEIEKIDDKTSILTIRNSDGDMIYYILDQNGQTTTTPKKGKETTFIADGVKILEIK